jgi:hypothetical protein
MKKLVVTIVVAIAFAATASAEDRKKAAKLFEAGEAAYADADFQNAAQYFEAAYAQYAAPEIAFSAAQAYRLLSGKEVQRPEYVKRAIELYELYVGKIGKGARVGDALAHLDKLRARWRDLVASGKATDANMVYDRTQLTILVDTRIAGAVVRIDGKDVQANKYVDVDPGNHAVDVEAPGHAPFRQTVEVAKGSQPSVQATLEPQPATIAIKGESGVRVTIDGRAAPLRGNLVEAPSGKHYVAITRRGRKPFGREIELLPGQSFDLEPRLQPSEQRRVTRFIWIGTAAIGAVAIGTTVGAFIYDSKASSVRDGGIDNGDDADDYNRFRNRRDMFRTTSIVLGGVAVFSAAAALALHVFDNPQAEAPPPIAPPKSGDPKFTPMVFGDGAGIGVGGAW